jgi:triosephosphate isomerase
MRKRIVAGNWKMNGTVEEAERLATGIREASGEDDNPEIIVCPPFTSIPAVLKILGGSKIAVGGQNMHWEDDGAFTGEISGRMLLTLGCSHVILGHSERRQHFFESDLTVNAKLKQALTIGLTPIVCVGESLEQREAEQTENVVTEQVLGAFDGIDTGGFARVTIAYEPVWAIGTGKTATPEQAEEVHRLIRGKLRDKYGELVDEVRVLYGGSVKPDNAGELFSRPNIDGGLIGGASLSAESFVAIIQAAQS